MKKAAAAVVREVIRNFSQPAPYGPCAPANDNCDQPAVHRHPEGNLVCRVHLPPETLWAPFLGKQERFMATTERYVLFGGSAGPGKSDCAIRKWIPQWHSEHLRWVRGEIDQSVGHVLVLRRQIPELLQLIGRFKRFMHRLDAGADWNEAKRICTFSCGYIVQFAGIENDDDWEKYYGPEYTMVIFDEATQFTVEQIEQLDSRIRTTDPALAGSLQLILCTNPVGHETKLWLRQRYVEAAPAETTVIIRTKLRDGRVVDATQVYIPASIYDNPAILSDGQYEANLMRKGSAMKRALLDGDWYVDAGSWVGDDWDPSIHICEPFEIPATWTKLKSGDYGHASNSSIQWFAVDFDGNMVCYRSLTIKGKTAEQLGAIIRELESETLYAKRSDGTVVKVTGPEWDKEAGCSTVWGPMDQSLWSKMGETGPSRGEILDRMGCGFMKADRSRESAADQVRTRLQRRTPNASGDLVVPGIRWFSSCTTKQRVGNKVITTGPIITIPAIDIDPNNPDLWNTKGDDHDLDSAGYGCLYRMTVPERGEEMDELAWRRGQMPETSNESRVSGFPGNR